MKTKEKSDSAQGVAETDTDSSAAEAPGGPATFDSPGVVGTSSCDCPDCGDSEAPVPAAPRTFPEKGYFSESFGVVGVETDELKYEQFVFTCAPGDLPVGDFQDCYDPDAFMAFWVKDELIVADPVTDERFRVVYCQRHQRAAARGYWTWYCERVGVTDPCDEEFLRGISS